MKIENARSRPNIRKNFFSQRIVNDWKKLPQNIVDALIFNSLKNRIDRLAEDISNRSRYASTSSCKHRNTDVEAMINFQKHDNILINTQLRPKLVRQRYP